MQFTARFAHDSISTAECDVARIHLDYHIFRDILASSLHTSWVRNTIYDHTNTNMACPFQNYTANSWTF